MSINGNTKHFLHRAGFGPAVKEVKDIASIEKWVSQSSGNRPIDVAEKIELNASALQKENRKEIIEKAKTQIVTLNAQWITQLTSPGTLLREKMTLFWHDHFACRIRAPFLAQQQNNVLRHHALGNFGNLLMAVSKDPAMLQFLNNQQNKKNSPNENFAREVLELFTLGRGNYTEEDIRNAARAFTGWSFRPATGKFFFRENVHDAGVKTFRGKQGNFTGEDILKLIVDDRQTAVFITGKIWDYFVEAGTPDPEIINALADAFYKSGYDIQKLLLKIFTSDWFYDKRYRGNRIKSPVELIASIMIQTGGTFQNPQALVFIQRALSQLLFFPPNVGGWPTGTGWIDSSSLTFRMSLPATLLKNTETTVEAKDDGDVNNATNAAGARKFSFQPDWTSLAQRFVKNSVDETLTDLEDYLLAAPTSSENRKIVASYSGKSKDDPEFIKKAFIGFMSLPEYQLS